jgi:site-specific DNA-cytosine methylase
VRDATQFHAFAGIGVWSDALRLAGWRDDAAVWTGSCPCQPFSTASAGKRRGSDDRRHLWPTWFHLIEECRPPTILGEQVVNLEWFDSVVGDLERIGYAVGAAVLCSSLLGFPRRPRLFFVAHANGKRKCDVRIDAEVARLQAFAGLDGDALHQLHKMDKDSYGDSVRLAERRAYGNAINPEVAIEFIRSVMEIDHRNAQEVTF